MTGKPTPMADDALTRKEAEMDGLREFIEEKRSHFNTKLGYMPLDERTKAKCRLEIALCDLALRALSLESVREEALDVKQAYEWSRMETQRNRWIRAIIIEVKALRRGVAVSYPVESDPLELLDHATPTDEQITLAESAELRALQHAPARVAEGDMATEMKRVYNAMLPDESPAKEQPGEQYRRGFEDGIRAYAWYKDGVQEVGTTGRTLRQALADVEKTWNYSPPPTGAPMTESDTPEKKYKQCLLCQCVGPECLIDGLKRERDTAERRLAQAQARAAELEKLLREAYGEFAKRHIRATDLQSRIDAALQSRP